MRQEKYQYLTVKFKDTKNYRQFYKYKTKNWNFQLIKRKFIYKLLLRIQWIWYNDFHDARRASPKFTKQFSENNSPLNKVINERRAKDHQLLEEICQKQGVPVELVEQLLQIEKDKSGLMRRNNLFKDIDIALKNYLKRQENEANFAVAV